MNSCGTNEGKPSEIDSCSVSNETTEDNETILDQDDDTKEGREIIVPPPNVDIREEPGAIEAEIRDSIVLTRRSVKKPNKLDDVGVFEISTSEKPVVDKVFVTPLGVKEVDGERVVSVEVRSGDDVVVEDVKEFGKKRIGNYDVAVKSLDKEKVDVSVITKEAVDETKKAVFLAPQEGFVCFDFEGVQSDRVVAGKRVLEGNPNVEVVDGKKVITVSFGDYTKEFELRQGQNFFVVIKKEGDQQRFVATN